MSGLLSVLFLDERKFKKMKKQIKNGDIRGFLEHPLTRFNGDNRMMRGYYKTKEGDILGLSPLFCIRMKNVETDEMPPDSFYTLYNRTIYTGNPYPVAIERYTQALDSKNALWSAEFNWRNMLNRLSRLSGEEMRRSRVILSESFKTKSQRFIVFTGYLQNGHPVAELNGKPIVGLNVREGMPNFRLGVPYLVDRIGVANGGGYLHCTILKEKGAVQWGVLCSPLYWEPDEELWTANALPVEWVENSNAYWKKDPNVLPYPFHLSATMLYDMLKLFMLTDSKRIRISVMAPEVQEAEVFRMRKGGVQTTGQKQIEAQCVKEEVPEPLVAVIQNIKENENDADISVVVGGLAYTHCGYQEG